MLKSILQKSVRRRRPLPAVRVAMELMDKAMGELLRRLPIIMLEDSTLHPELPLLVWVMVADSKVSSGRISFHAGCLLFLTSLLLRILSFHLNSSQESYVLYMKFLLVHGLTISVMKSRMLNGFSCHRPFPYLETSARQ